MFYRYCCCWVFVFVHFENMALIDEECVLSVDCGWYLDDYVCVGCDVFLNCEVLFW